MTELAGMAVDFKASYFVHIFTPFFCYYHKAGVKVSKDSVHTKIHSDEGCDVTPGPTWTGYSLLPGWPGCASLRKEAQ